MKLLPPKKDPWRRAAKKALDDDDRISGVITRCRVNGLSAKEIIDALKAAQVAKMEILRLSMKRGRAKGGGRSSKAKGRSAVVVVRDLLLRTFDLEPDDILVKATSMGGCDIHMSPQAQQWFPFAIEVKNAESLSVWKAMAQATVNAKKKKAPPVLFFKRARSPLYVTFRAEDLLNFMAPE
jgi:hypothetical protein